MVTAAVERAPRANERVPRARRRWAAWLLPVVLAVGAYLGRANLGHHALVLTLANVAFASLVVLSLRNKPFRSAWLWAVVIVLLDGGFLQLFWLSYKLHTDPVYLAVYTPGLAWIAPRDIESAYRELSLLWAVFACFAAGAVRVGTLPRFPQRTELTRLAELKRVVTLAGAGYALATLVQVALGFGLYGTATAASLPFHLTTVISFYRQNFFPAILILGAWCFDRAGHQQWLRRCVAALGVVAAVEAYVSTSRGTILNYGIPLLFLWILTGRMTKGRKSVVIFGIIASLALSPILTTLRSQRLFASHAITAVSVSQPNGITVSGIVAGLQRSIIRVGGAQGILITQAHSQPLGLNGLPRVFAPNGLIVYYTYQVVRLRQDTALFDLRSPSAPGAAILVGGPIGAALVVLIVLVLLGLCWMGIGRRCRSWPVGCALFCGAVVNYFSEGNMVFIYKALLAAAVIEWIYRRYGGRNSGGRTSGRTSAEAPSHQRMAAGTAVSAPVASSA